MSVISATDYFTELALGREGFEAVVRARNSSLEEELAIRAARVEELRRGVVWRKPPPAALPPSTARPAWSKRPQTATEKHPWSIVLRSEASRAFEICLQGDTSWKILQEVSHVTGEDLETGGHLWSRERARLRSADVVYATGAGVPGQLHGRRSMKLPREADARAAMPDWLHPLDLVAVGDWHLHMSAGSGTPSQADLDSWASVLYARDRSLLTWASIIVAPDGPLGPRFHGYITRRDGERGRYVCHPAALSDRLGYCS